MSHAIARRAPGSGANPNDRSARVVVVIVVVVVVALELPEGAPAVHSRDKPRKVFGIGLSKTGTTSLSQALRILKYRNSDMSSTFWDEARCVPYDAEREREIDLGRETAS